MATPVGEDVLAGGSLAVLAVAVTLAVVVLVRLDDAQWGPRLRRRFVLGVPWGTVVVVVLVVCVYLFVQDAWGALSAPLVVPFRSWSYGYPLGMLTASFAHGNLSHLTGNLLATVVFAPVVEFAWSHYPTERGSQSFSLPMTNPFVRILAFVAVVFLVGLAASLFVPGPSVGFSGVVFAFAGFALVVAPIRSVLAVVGVRVVRTAYYAVTDPAPTRFARLEYVEPWFADVSVQGHAFGLIVGVLLGVAFLARRSATPSVRHVWYATLAFAVTETLYAFYWYVGTDGYLFLRGAGLAAVFVLVALVAGAVTAGIDPGTPRRDLSWRHLAVGGLLATTLAIGGVAVVYNLADVGPVDQDPVPGSGTALEVRDYTVFYAEDVEHGYISAVDPPLGDDLAASARASGVIVASDRRDAWEEVVPASQLALDGRATVAVGGLGWRESIVATRTGWEAVGGNETYKVFLRRPGSDPQLAYAAEPVPLGPQIAGYDLAIEPVDRGFRLTAARNETAVDAVSVPEVNETVAVADLSIERRNDTLVAVHDGTRVTVAQTDGRREIGR